MKKIISMLLPLLLLACPMPAQEADVNEIMIDPIECQPSFPGGEDSLRAFIAKNLRYPLVEECVQGRVVVLFTVETDGSISEIEVVKNFSPEFDAEAVRVIKTMPKWIPGRIGDKPVRVRYSLPIRFKL